MNFTQEELNQLNQENAATPGKIAAVYDWSTETEKFIYKVDDFIPQCQDLLITQIWTQEQEQLVQLKIKQITKNLSSLEFFNSNTDVLELIRLYEMQIEWLANTLDYVITTSD
jgi:hypothetical protein